MHELHTCMSDSFVQTFGLIIWATSLLALGKGKKSSTNFHGSEHEFSQHRSTDFQKYIHGFSQIDPQIFTN